MTVAVENIKPLKPSSVEVTENYVAINGFQTTASAIVNLFNEDPENNPEELLEQVLRLGTETLRIMGTSATSEILENVANEVKSGMESKKLEIVSDMEDMAKKMVAETGELSVKNVLQSWRTEFATLLTNSFDANRADSIMTKFDEAMKSWAENQQEKVIKELNLNLTGSSLYGLNDRLTKHITETVETVKNQLKGIETALNIDEATKDVKKKVAARGTVFEDLVFEEVEVISMQYRDTADNPGKTKTKGVDGNDEGDITVEINGDETRGKSLCFVWECKVRSTKQSDRWLYDELKKGVSNRGAKAGVIVTDATTAIGVGGDEKFFRENGNNAILILDPLDPDPNAIKFAYLWSRWICRRDDASLLDVGSVRDVMESIQRELSVITAIKTHHTKIAKELELVEPKVDGLETNVKVQLNKLQELIESTEGSDD
jgi:hypothetical protein